MAGLDLTQTEIITIPYRPRYPQTIIHPELDRHRFNVIVAHRRLGKTVMFINHTIRKAVRNQLESPRYAYFAPFLKQAKLIAWDYLKRFGKPVYTGKPNESELFIEILNGARIYLLGADNPDAIRGIYLDGVVLDEYAQMKPQIWGEIVRPTLADRNGWAVFGGTPKGQNQLYEVTQHAIKAMNEGDPNWFCGLYPADETGVIPQDELELLKEVMSEAQFRQEFLCDFTAAADNVLITIDIATEASFKKYTERDVYGAPRIIGVDPARFGDDRSTIMRRQGLQAFTPKIFSKIDNMDLVGHVVREIVDFKPDAVFIDAGRGEGVIDRLRQLGYDNIFEINFGGAASNPAQYANKRTEIWDLMADWLNQGGAIPNNPELKKDLVTPTYSYNTSNKMILEPKDKIKERLGKSTDLGDALALTFSMPVHVRPAIGQIHNNINEFYNRDYDVI